ncbi:MAG: ABC transporter permease [Chloroflexota bacterium]|nr:ABC transporter permease [Chloroflexia bacterium]MDQ3226993.1 ABC transporter permease [Chloroflexota bacterium]
MGQYVARRLLQAIPLLFLISVISFMLIRLSGDPMSMYGQSSALTAEDRDRIMAQHGWDKPKPIQYLFWLRDLARGDLGSSLYTYQPVTQMIWEKLPNTLILMGTVFVVTIVVSIPLAIVSALRQYSTLDYLITGASFFAFALPTFWLGLVCIMIFSVKFKEWGLPYMPAGGMYDLVEGPSLPGLVKHLVMPALVLSVVSMASYIRYLRASMLEVLRDDYIRTARAKGLPELAVTWRHAFRNALIPLVTLITMNIPLIFSGALITEQVFAWPGMGRLFVDHANRGDYPVLMGLVLTVSVLVIFFNLVADIAYAAIDPRIRFQ